MHDESGDFLRDKKTTTRKPNETPKQETILIQREPRAKSNQAYGEVIVTQANARMGGSLVGKKKEGKKRGTRGRTDVPAPSGQRSCPPGKGKATPLLAVGVRTDRKKEKVGREKVID